MGSSIRGLHFGKYVQDVNLQESNAKDGSK
jgi:hypothetical protein